METPLQVTFRGFTHEATLDQFIRDQARELEEVAGNRMTSCHVVVEIGHQHHHEARVFHARIDLSLPGGVVAANREGHDQHSHEDPFTAVRDAFAAAHRQVQDWERRHHGQS